MVIPDLLRRFVESSDVSSFVVAGFYVTLETNDRSLIGALEAFGASCDSAGQVRPSYWKLIRDDIAPRGGKDLNILSSGSLGAVLIGSGTVLVVDRERSEVLGFIAPDISDFDLVGLALPRVLDLLSDPEILSR